MNRKQLLILLVLVAILGAGGLFIYNKQNESRRGGNPTIGKKLLGEFPVNDVAQILIRQGTNQLTLTKKDDLWRVEERQDYPANYQELSGFLMKVRELKAVQMEEIGPSQLPRLSLVPGEGTNAATVVEFKDKSGKLMSSLILGKKHMRKSPRPSPFGDMGDQEWPDGRYVQVGGDAKKVALISEPLSNIEPKPEQWVGKDFVKVEKPQSIEVAYPEATNSWKVIREQETSDWKLVDAQPDEQLDKPKTSSFAGAFSSPSFSDVATPEKIQELGLVNPTTIKIETFDNFSYLLKIGQKTNDSYPVMVDVSANLAAERSPGPEEKAEDKDRLDKEFKDKQQKLQEKLAQEKRYENWVYFVSSWTIDSLLKKRSELMAEKKEEVSEEHSHADGEDHSHDEPLTPSSIDPLPPISPGVLDSE